MKKRIFITVFGILGIALIVTRGFSQWPGMPSAKNSQQDHQEHQIPDNDSVEVIGTPINADPWTEMDQLVKAFNLKGGLKIKGNIKVIDDNADTEKVVEQESFEFAGIGERYSYKLGSVEFTESGKFSLMADHQNKVISVASHQKKQQKFKPFEIEEFKKLMSEQEANAIVTEFNGQRVITIDNIRHPKMQGYRIYYSPADFRISKILVGMASPVSMTEDPDAVSISAENSGSDEYIPEYYYYAEMTYDEIAPLSVSGNSFKPEEKFVNYRRGQFTLNTQYKNYQLISSIEH